jgi:hypothetical protein
LKNIPIAFERFLKNICSQQKYEQEAEIEQDWASYFRKVTFNDWSIEWVGER